MNSPPKRMTRARAAAKASEPGLKTTKIVTAAARAKAATRSTATASTRSTAAKRKTRSDETDVDDSEPGGDAARKFRGRPRKGTVTEDEKQAAGSSGKEDSTRTTESKVDTTAARVRTRKAIGQDGTSNAAAPTSAAVGPVPRKMGRSRASTLTKITASAAAKATTKKAVKFDEPDKENIEPPQKTRTTESNAVRSRPAAHRSAPAKNSSAATASTNLAEDAPKKPLSPKKVTQMPISRDESEDELAEKVHAAGLQKTPVKPSNGAANTKKSDLDAFDKDADSTVAVNAAILDGQDLTTGFGSPPRRPPTSPYKDALKSPAKKIGSVPLPGAALRPTPHENDSPAKVTTSCKSTLLQTPAKRPQAFMKGLNFASASKAQPSKNGFQSSIFQSPPKRAMPGLKPLSERAEFSVAICATPSMQLAGVDSRKPSEKLMLEEDDEPLQHREQITDDLLSNPIDSPQFPGRMSSVLPRFADPVVDENMDDSDEDEVELVQTFVFDEEQTGQFQHEINNALPHSSREILLPTSKDKEAEAVSEKKPAQKSDGAKYQLREADLDPCHDMTCLSEDTHFQSMSPMSHEMQTPTHNARRGTIGLTALAEQFGTWTAGSPQKIDETLREAPKPEKMVTETQTHSEVATIGTGLSPDKSSFFEDEMLVHTQPNPSDKDTNMKRPPASLVQEPSFDDIMITDEDVELNLEANELSHSEEPSRSFNDEISEASQEYGDENQIPIDPALLGRSNVPPGTPMRSTTKSFFTTTKIPLKAADESTPSPLKKRSFSASRIPSNGTGSLPKSATVISYSPTKEKNDLWSTMGTPAGSPRKECDPALLRGAVVFVDVHTSEGADASCIFVDLLHQMGARCVKSWNWNPSHSLGSEPNDNKVGITHVVYKDGGKRTMEKVREAKGLVQCVGVSWVLDCERENDWLDEAPYVIDTKFVPRGGARRRKSMEPKALSNQNGTLVATPAKGQQTTPYNRRQSSVWMHTPSDQGDNEGGDDVEWSQFILTPVPKTPAPEAVAKYASEIPATPSFGEDDSYDYSPSKMEMQMRTCPPKSLPIRQMGDGILSPEKNEQVMQRLMAARRKSLQFAPKIGSPLSKTWH